MIRSYLDSESLHTKNTKFDFSNWKDSFYSKPEQQNNFDCGVFVSVFQEHRSRFAQPKFLQADMPDFRVRMAIDITTVKLNGHPAQHSSSPPLPAPSYEHKDFDEGDEDSSPSAHQGVSPVFNLINLGNTCFISSTMQVLLPLIKGTLSEYTERSPVLSKLRELRIAMFEKGGTRALHEYQKLVDIISLALSFEKGRQQDASELVNYIAEEGLGQPKMASNACPAGQKEKSQLCTWIAQTTVKCNVCSTERVIRKTPFHALPIVIDPTSGSFLPLASHYSQVEDTNCDKCKAKVTHSQNEEYTASQGATYFILCAQRWSFSNGVATKLSNNFDSGRMMERMGCELVSFLEHVGTSANSGHYVGYRRVCSNSSSWRVYDDLKSGPTETDEPPIRRAFILLYRARNARSQFLDFTDHIDEIRSDPDWVQTEIASAIDAYEQQTVGQKYKGT